MVTLLRSQDGSNRSQSALFQREQDKPRRGATKACNPCAMRIRNRFVAAILERANLHSAYVSTELTHFAGRGLPEGDQYAVLLSILRTGHLRGPGYQQGVHVMHPYASMCGNDMYVPTVVCFCDIPSGSLGIHMAKYSQFGLSLRKDFLVQQGANPVFYVVRDSFVEPNAWPQSLPVPRPAQVLDPYDQAIAQPALVTKCAYFDVMLQMLHSALTIEMAVMAHGGQQGTNAYRRLSDLNSFLSLQLMAFVKFFDHSLPAEDAANYYMEREWRVLGDVHFTLRDIARVIVPKAYRARLVYDMPSLKQRLLAV